MALVKKKSEAGGQPDTTAHPPTSPTPPHPHSAHAHARPCRRTATSSTRFGSRATTAGTPASRPTCSVEASRRSAEATATTASLRLAPGGPIAPGSRTEMPWVVAKVWKNLGGSGGDGVLRLWFMSFSATSKPSSSNLKQCLAQVFGFCFVLSLRRSPFRLSRWPTSFPTLFVR